MSETVSCSVQICPLQPVLLHFLKELERILPPPAGCHHAITYAQYGSYDEGWSDRLALQVNHRGRFYCFFIEDKDLLKGFSRVVREIQAALQCSEELQPGVGFGQYRSSGELSK